MKKPTVDGNQKSGENQLDRLVVYPMIYKLLLHPRWFEIAGFLIAINIVMPFTWIFIHGPCGRFPTSLKPRWFQSFFWKF